jgi:hypothetical protein
MGNQYENMEFRSAMQSASVYGSDWQGNDALDDCSEAFHNEIDRDQRAGMGFDEMRDWASDWWSMNSQKYS